MLSQQLRQKLEQSKMVIEDMLDAYSPENTLIAWSAGKDSTLVLKLLLDVCQQRNITPPRALDIDQNDQFNELIVFRDAIVKEWNIDLLVVKNHDFLSKVSQFGDSVKISALDETNQAALKSIDYASDHIIWEPESPVCNHLLKTVPIHQAIESQNIQAMLTGIRWDEHGARENETYFSERENPNHIRVHPILHLTERNIWDCHFELAIPFNSLYEKGYRSLGSKTGTKKHTDIPAWEQDLEHTTERGERSAEKEKVMAQLRKWGYL